MRIGREDEDRIETNRRKEKRDTCI